MKWKLTLRYILSVGIVAVIVVMLNIFMVIGVLYYKNITNKLDNIEFDAREFQEYVYLDNNKVELDSKGKKYLKENDLWVQILDEDNREVYSYRKPNDVKTKHTPIDIVDGYKYSGKLDKNSDILVGYKVIDNKTYTYIIGYPMSSMRKYTIILKYNNILSYANSMITLLIIVDFIVAIIIGYIFSMGITKPTRKIITAIDDLASDEYDIHYKEKGIYGKVFEKINYLSNKLIENEVERKNIENMREDWIANISHDIKTPLSSIKGYAEILNSGYDFSNDDILEYADIINNKADYIKELVDDLNLTMKLKNNSAMISKQETNIVQLVRNEVIDILNDPIYSETNIEFMSNKEKIIKNIDYLLIKRVVNNLVYNSIIHNDENVKIWVNVYEDDKAHIIISDNGKGIEKEDLKYIFERYYRGTNTGKAHKGSGLGMAIVKDIVKAHDGEVIINSQINKGTAIEIVL